MKIRVCGLDFDDIGTEHAVRAALTGGNACFVVTPNALMLEDCARSPEHLRLLSGASLILPDGGGVVRAAARLGNALCARRVAGIDFGEALLSACAARGERVFLLGGADGVAACAAENLRRRFPALTIAGTYWGYFDRDGEENRNLISVIRACRPTVLPVCLGYPAQEEWIARNLPLLPSVRVAAGLGGSLDVWAGPGSSRAASLAESGAGMGLADACRAAQTGKSPGSCAVFPSLPPNVRRNRRQFAHRSRFPFDHLE